MKLRTTALFMILWFACQQVAAMAPASLFQVVPAIDVHTAVACHEHGSPGMASDANPKHDHISATQQTQDVVCCEIGCQCCISGCQSLLGSTQSLAIVSPTITPHDAVVPGLPQTPARSLYRPPISR